jgi:hypothetical protein
MRINYRRQKIYTLHVLTHKGYDKERWLASRSQE